MDQMKVQIHLSDQGQVLGVFFLNDMTFRSCLSAIDVFFFMLVFVYGFVLFFRCDTFSSVLYLFSFLTFFMDTQHNTLRYSKFLATSSLLLKKKTTLCLSDHSVSDIFHR